MSDDEDWLREVRSALYRLDWMGILQDAIESRPSSWGYPDRRVETENGYDHPVVEWRNASDQLILPVWQRLKEELGLEEKIELGGTPDGKSVDAFKKMKSVPSAGYLVKIEGCPTCEGERTAKRYRLKHVEVDGEYYELITAGQIREGVYSDEDFEEKHELVMREHHRGALSAERQAQLYVKGEEQNRVLNMVDNRIEDLQELLDSIPNDLLETETGQAEFSAYRSKLEEMKDFRQAYEQRIEDGESDE